MIEAKERKAEVKVEIGPAANTEEVAVNLINISIKLAQVEAEVKVMKKEQKISTNEIGKDRVSVMAQAEV